VNKRIPVQCLNDSKPSERVDYGRLISYEFHMNYFARTSFIIWYCIIFAIRIYVLIKTMHTCDVTWMMDVVVEQCVMYDIEGYNKHKHTNNSCRKWTTYTDNLQRICRIYVACKDAYTAFYANSLYLIHSCRINNYSYCKLAVNIFSKLHCRVGLYWRIEPWYYFAQSCCVMICYVHDMAQHLIHTPVILWGCWDSEISVPQTCPRQVGKRLPI